MPGPAAAGGKAASRCADEVTAGKAVSSGLGAVAGVFDVPGALACGDVNRPVGSKWKYSLANGVDSPGSGGGGPSNQSLSKASSAVGLPLVVLPTGLRSPNAACGR